MLKPKRVEIDCVYICPDCGSEIWYTIKEMKYRKFFECACTYKEKLAPVSRVLVEYKGEETELFCEAGEPKAMGTKTKPKPKPKKPPAEDLSGFVATLTTMGFKKAEAQLRVSSNASKYDGDDGKFFNLIMSGET